MMIGIYILTNKVNHKQYVGQSIDIDRRLREYSHNSRRRRQPISHAVHKYGIDNFEIEKIECKEEELDRLEREWITNLKCIAPNGYNLETGGNKNKHIANETKKKIALKHTGKLKGPLSEETRLKLSLSKKGKPKSEEHKKKIGLANRGKPRSESVKQMLREFARTRTGSLNPNWKGGIKPNRKTPEHLKKERERYAKKMLDPIWREKRNELARLRRKNPEIKAKQYERNKKWIEKNRERWNAYCRKRNHIAPNISS